MPDRTPRPRVLSIYGGKLTGWRAVSEREVRDSILTNLIAMCGTRVGTMLTCPDFGIADISEMVYSFPEAITLMASTLKHTIQTYEPRLKNVQVRHIRNEQTNNMSLEFEVTGQLVLPDGRRQSLRFATAVDGNGSVRVSS